MASAKKATGRSGGKRASKAARSRRGVTASRSVRKPTGSVRVRTVRESIRLTQPAMARMLGISQRTLSGLENNDTKLKPELQRRVTEADRLRVALEELLEEADIGDWLETRNEAFGGATPLQLIERGEIDRIWQMIHAVRTGHPI